MLQIDVAAVLHQNKHGSGKILLFVALYVWKTRPSKLFINIFFSFLPKVINETRNIQ